jgi:hypothetical protein
MKKKRKNGGKLAVAVAGLSMALAITASADCGIPATRFATLSRLSAASIPGGASLTEQAALQASAADDHSRDADAPGASIVGLWRTTFTSGGQVVDEGFDLWNSDGTEVLNDDPAPATGNVCLGVYVRSSRATYKLKHPSWTFDNAGNVNGTAIIREQVTVAAGGNSYAGTYTIDIYDLSNNLLAHFAGPIAAQRITVDF